MPSLIEEWNDGTCTRCGDHTWVIYTNKQSHLCMVCFDNSGELPTKAVIQHNKRVAYNAVRMPRN